MVSTLIFRRFFAIFDANIRGLFEWCRKFIGIDGIYIKSLFSKGLYNNILLIAININANLWYLSAWYVYCTNWNHRVMDVFFKEVVWAMYVQIGCNVVRACVLWVINKIVVWGCWRWSSLIHWGGIVVGILMPTSRRSSLVCLWSSHFGKDVELQLNWIP